MSRAPRWLLSRRSAPAGSQRGQAVVMVAFGIVAFVGITGLAVDSGRAYLDRRALQGGADTASEAGTSMLAANFHQPAAPFTDPQVAAQVAAQVNNSRSGPSGLSAFTPTAGGAAACDTRSSTPPQDLTTTCAWYTDAMGNLLVWPGGFTASGRAVQVGNGTMPPVCPPSIPPDPAWGATCTAGVSVVPYFMHDTYFMRALGQPTAAERAVGTSTFAPILTAKDSGIAHYAVWFGCSAGDATSVDVGDQVVIRDNGWTDSAGCGQTGLGPNDLKGWFHDPVISTPATSNGCGATCAPPQGLSCSGTAKTVFTELDYFCMKGGNAIGLEAADVAIIHASWQSCQPGSSSGPCQPVLLPEFDMLNGGGSGIEAHIKGWVAAVPDGDWNSPSQNPWTVHIVALVGRRGDWTGGCPSPPCPNPPPSTPVAISLVQ